MSLLHEDAANVFHRPLLYNGRIIQANGYALVSRAHPQGEKAGKMVEDLIGDVMDDTRAAERCPDALLNPELIAELADDMGGVVLALWVGSDATKPVIVQCDQQDAFGVLMPMKAPHIGPLGSEEPRQCGTA